MPRFLRRCHLLPLYRSLVLLHFQTILHPGAGFTVVLPDKFASPTHQSPSASLAMSSSSNSSPNSENHARVDFTKTETVGETRWMRLETLSYQVPTDDDTDTDGNGLRKWDRVVRTTKKSENSVDAVVILAILKHDPKDPLKDQVVCVKQFRPPIDAYTIELPAGLIDPEEDPAQAAVREFNEETGYVGKVMDVSPPSFLSPGLTNESACMVRLDVDMTLPENMNNHSKWDNQNLEGCERDRGLEKLLLPRIGLLDSLHALQKRDGVKIFAALYSLAVGMSVGEGDVNSDKPSISKDFPLVNIKLTSKNGDDELHPTDATCHAVTSALRNSGFLMIKTPFLPLELQHRALKAASKILEFKSSSMVVTHPKDPKVYAMLHGVSFIGDASVDPVVINDLKEWYHAVRSTKELLLYCIAVGLGMDDNPNFFSKLHNQDNDALRLLQYLPGDKTTGNRCKEHSDYGTITLLLTDGVRGLEAFIDGKWSPVPYEEGAIIVNIGSLLSEWTRQELKATLHRVAGPASKGSSTPTAALLDAVSVPRTSIAYFADPNEDVSVALEDSEKIGVASINGMSVTEYIEWRSGGEGPDRSGVAFTSAEELRLKP